MVQTTTHSAGTRFSAFLIELARAQYVWHVVVVVVVAVVAAGSTPAQLCPSSGTHIYGGGSIYAMEQSLRWSLAQKRDDHIPRAASHASATHGVRMPALSTGAGGSSTFIHAVPQQVLKQADSRLLKPTVKRFLA